METQVPALETQDPTQETLGLKFETIHDDEYHKDGTAISKSVYVLLYVCARVSVCMRPCVYVCVTRIKCA